MVPAADEGSKSIITLAQLCKTDLPIYIYIYYAKKNPFIDVTAVPHLPECSMTPRVQ